MDHPLYDAKVRTLSGEAKTLAEHRDKVLLIVNTASECGFTPQLGGLERLHRKYGERGLVVLGFPCAQFANQEPREGDEIGVFCQKNYGVSFPVHDKIKVNGPDAHPLYEHLKSAQKGLLGTSAVKWNFTKFLVDREGKVVARYAPTTKPEQLEEAIESLLGAEA